MKSSRTFHQIQLHAQDTTNRLVEKFPSINFTSTSRALMSLSKREKMDGLSEFLSTHISKQIKPKIQQREMLRVTHNTQTSINRFREAQKSLTKIGKTLNFVKKFQQQKLKPELPINKPNQLSKLNRYQQIEKEFTPTKMLIKQQNNAHSNGEVKFCDKKFGIIEGYAISSHVGRLCSQNNTRICVSTNVLQNYNKSKQVSFFGLFQGRNGSNRAEYMRQHFHTTLVNDQLFYYNFQRAVARTYDKIQRDFNYDPRYDGDYSIVSSVICVIIGSRMYIVRQGAPNATLSMNLGAYIKSLTFQAKQIAPPLKHSVSSMSTYSTRILPQKQTIHVRMFEVNKNYDFVILGNEGLYHAANQKNQLGTDFWKYMLDESNIKNKTLSQNKIAKACNKICEDAVLTDSLGRSMSIIVIGLKNLSACFQEPPVLNLPYTNGNMNNFSIRND